MPPERSVPRVTAVALDVGHGVVVVVVLAVTLSLSLSLSFSLTCAATTVCLMVLPRAASFSRTSWSSSKPLWRGFVFFPDISEESSEKFAISEKAKTKTRIERWAKKSQGGRAEPGASRSAIVTVGGGGL